MANAENNEPTPADEEKKDAPAAEAAATDGGEGAKQEKSPKAEKGEPEVKAEAEAVAKTEEAKTEEPKAEEAKAEAPKTEEAAAEKPAGTEDRRDGRAPRGGGQRGGGRDQRGGGRGRRDGRSAEEILDGPQLMEKVVFINRCAKVVKGGRRFSFSALVVTGDQKGQVGYGFGKAKEVAECIRKASDFAKKDLETVALQDTTIPHEVIGEHGGGRVLLRPASEGTGIIAGGSMRAVLEAAGVKDILAKSLGSNNHANVVKATLDALRQLRTREQVMALRGKKTAAQKAI